MFKQKYMKKSVFKEILKKNKTFFSHKIFQKYNKKSNTINLIFFIRCVESQRIQVSIVRR